MSRRLIVHAAGPGMSVQDMGRPGYLAYGLSRGGAADRQAIAEGAALLHQDQRLAALEMAGMGGSFEVSQDTRIALTGAPMRASIDGAPVAWNASHMLPAGSRLSIGGATRGVYGYLHLGGGIDAPDRLGARSAHLAAGIGGLVAAGTDLPLGEDRAGGETGLTLPMDDRFDGGEVRVVPGFQTGFFAGDEITRFEATLFTRAARGNRMGVRLDPDGCGFCQRCRAFGSVRGDRAGRYSDHRRRHALRPAGRMPDHGRLSPHRLGPALRSAARGAGGPRRAAAIPPCHTRRGHGDRARRGRPAQGVAIDRPTPCCATRMTSAIFCPIN